jgi:hypothetical protein
MSRERSRGDDPDTKQLRFEHPSGVLRLFRHESVAVLVDGVLDMPPRREFTRTEFADHTGLTRQTVSSYVDLLVEMDVLETVPNSSPRRYRVAESAVVQQLHELNSALNTAGE